MAEINIEKMAQNVAKKAIQELENNGVFVGRWIPVSEGLPKVADCYAVTRQIGSDLIVDACFFDGINTWHNDNRINHERNYLTNIVAWMPLPEPYKAESENK
jgi:hypothetical protein